LIYLGCLGVPNGAENINTDEMWAVMDDGSWMEAGIITGDVYYAGKVTYDDEPHFFISDQREHVAGSNAFYNEDVGSEAPTYTLNETFIRQESPEHSTTWKAWTAGTGWAIVPGFYNRYAAVDLKTGLETSENEGWNDAAVAAMEYLNWNGDVYTTEWKYSSTNAKAEILGPGSGSQQMYFDWEHQNYEADFGYHNHGC
jgi:hypothetical protein